MKNKIFLAFSVLFCVVFLFSFAHANSLSLKLPFEKNESFLVTMAYGTKPTHLSNDSYAIDFVQQGCSAYNKKVLSVAEGEVVLVSTGHSYGESKSYGNRVDIIHEGNIISRYGHLNEIFVKKGDKIRQGQIVGTIGNTGTCFGSVCKEHPGAHLHFAMYKDGKPYKPEPMSGYTGFKAGEWYTSDNTVYQPDQKTEQEVPWWQKIFNWFKKLFERKSGEVASEQESQNTTPAPPQAQESQDEPEPPQDIFNATYISQSPYLNLNGGEVATLSVSFKNTGNTKWTQSQTSLNLAGSGEDSPFYHNSWLTAKRPAKLDQKTIKPGETGSFTFTIQAPTKPGMYQLFVRPVYQDEAGFHWLGQDFGVFWLINVNEKITTPEPLPKQTNETATPPDTTQGEVKTEPNNTPTNNGGGNGGNNNGNQASNPPLPPVINEPTTDERLLLNSTSTIKLAGTKSPDSSTIFVWHNNQLIELSDFPSATSWQTEIILSAGDNELRVAAANGNGDISEEDKLIITCDLLPPTAINDLQAGRISSSTAKIIFSPPEPNLTFDLRYSLSNLDINNWDSASGTSRIITGNNTTSTISLLLDHLSQLPNLKFYIRAQDTVGRQSSLSNQARITVLPLIGQINGFEITPNSILADWLMPSFVKKSVTTEIEARYSTESINDGNFLQAEKIENTSSAEPNMLAEAKLNNLSSSTEYYLAVKYSDGLNWSDPFYSTKITTTDDHAEINGCANCAFLSDHELKMENGPYVIDGQIYLFWHQKLTIDPGTILKFKNGASIFALGSVEAPGTPERQIIFTSFADDDYGGDSNGDSEGSSPEAGSWSGITVRNSPSAQAIFNNTKIKYATDGLVVGNLSKLEITDSEISSSSRRAITLTNIVDVKINKNNIINNKLGIYLDNNKSTVISFNNIKNNNTGTHEEESGGILVAKVGDTTLNNNNIYNNNFWGIFAFDGLNFTVNNNYFGAIEGPIKMTMDEFLTDPHQFDNRGQRDIIHGDFDYGNLSPTEIGW